MPRRLEPKCKNCRREGEKLYLKGEKCTSGKCPIIQRNFRPGMHGPMSRVRHSTYGTQLREKQKAKESYGLQEKQFRIYFEKAQRGTGNTTDKLVQMLEQRLDNVVYRLGLAKSRGLARQMVGHGLIQVNGRKVNIPSYQVKSGDEVALTAKADKSKLYNEEEDSRLKNHQPPSWLLLDAANHSGKVLNRPEGEDLRQNFDPTLIVEFYSR